MDWLTTSTILQRLRSFEEESAWELLVEHFREPLVEIGLRMGLATADAQDVAQETLLTFARTFRSGSFDRRKGRLHLWLFGIARNEARKARQRVATHSERFTEPVDVPGEDELKEAWEKEWRWSIYQRALRKVESEVTRETFHLFRPHVTEQLSVSEVCRRLGVARTTVYNVKHRVARRVAELIREFEDE